MKPLADNLGLGVRCSKASVVDLVRSFQLFVLFQIELPVALKELVFSRSLIHFLHDLHSKVSKGSGHHLNHVETINDDLSVWKELSGKGVVIAVKVSAYRFDGLSGRFWELLKVLSDSALKAVLQNNYDRVLFAVLTDEVQLSADASEFVKSQVFRQGVK